MTYHRTETIGSVRESADQPRVLLGTAVPYGVVSERTELEKGSGVIVREAYPPEAFRESVEHWMGRKDGGRLAYRPRHGEKPVGTVTFLEDTPDGVAFRAAIFETPAGDDYLQEVRSGLNGVSIEATFPEPPRRMRDGTVLHRKAKLQGISGSDHPAFDGARIALRDMEAMMSDTDPKAPTPEPPKTPDPAPEPPKVPDQPAPSGERDAAVSFGEGIPPAVRDWLEKIDVKSRFPKGLGATITRQEPVYRPGGEHSFLRDLRDARQGDSVAAERQSRHEAHLTDVAVQIERAGDVLSTEIPGAYPNDYLPGLLTPRILKGRPMGGFYNRIPITDARPKIFAKVTTSTTVAVQSAEGANPAASDLATTAVTATPLLYGAETVVSRQVLDGGDPSAEQMIIQDMIEAYAQASETVIKTAVEAGASASGVAITAATPFAGLLGNLVAYQAARFTPATGQFIPPALYSVALTQADTTGRPFLATINPANAVGRIDGGGASASMLDARDFLSWASTVNVVVTGRPSDYVIYESSIARFSYDAVTGPAGVRLGIWAYLVVGTRLGSLKVTAA